LPLTGSAARPALVVRRCDDRVVRYLSSGDLAHVNRAIEEATVRAERTTLPDLEDGPSSGPPAPGPGAEPAKQGEAPIDSVARAKADGQSPEVAPLAPPPDLAPPAPDLAPPALVPPDALRTTPESPTPKLQDVPPPLGRVAWCSEPACPGLRRFGSASDAGPATAESDKGNQDFAFHLEIEAPGPATWVLVGVADGVSQATWAARGARHASAAFLEAFVDLSQHADFPRDEVTLASEAWSRTLARSFHRRVLERMTSDRDRLLAERRVDPTWARELFEKTFLDGPGAARETMKWFQTTLLAAALGPQGGFALFLGDGFARIDRRMRDGAWQSSSGLDPTRPVSFGLSEAEVFTGIARLSQRGAVEMGVLVTTDGVSKSSATGKARAMGGMGRLPGVPATSDEPLEQFAPATSDECARFLRTLASMPPELADVDNMSVAFASRTLDAPRSP
jgi:hypothetical protein